MTRFNDPQFGDKMDALFDAIGYRLLAKECTQAGIAKVLETNAISSIVRRMNGETAIACGELSKICSKYQLVEDGIIPSDFRDNDAASFKALLIDRGVGIYGQADGPKFIAAALNFKGEKASLGFIRQHRRGPGLVGAVHEGPGEITLRPREEIVLECKGPAGSRLLLLDQDLAVPTRLYQLHPSFLAPEDEKLPAYRQVPDGAPFRADSPGEHRLIGIWLHPEFGDEIFRSQATRNEEQGRRDTSHLDNISAAQFLQLDREVTRTLTEALTEADPGRVRATAAMDYSVY